MRRAWNALSDYVADLCGATIRGWNAFFFTPADPTALGVTRLLVGSLLVWSVGNLALDLHDYMGSNSWASVDLTKHYWSTRGSWTVWSFWLWVPDRMLWPVWAGCFAIAILFTLGVFTRLIGLLAWIVAIGTMQRSPVSM